MQPEAGSPSDWLKHAQSDLSLAKIEKPENVLYEELCFHAQQAAEKAMKAVLLAEKTAFPKTHSIRTLLDILAGVLDLPQNLHDAAILTDYAVQARYPADYEEIAAEEYQEAVKLAEAVFHWAKKILSA